MPPDIHAAQDGESEITITLKMRYRKRNVETPILQGPRVRSKTHGRTQIKLGQIKEVKLNGVVALD